MVRSRATRDAKDADPGWDTEEDTATPAVERWTRGSEGGRITTSRSRIARRASIPDVNTPDNSRDQLPAAALELDEDGEAIGLRVVGAREITAVEGQILELRADEVGPSERAGVEADALQPGQAEIRVFHPAIDERDLA